MTFLKKKSRPILGLVSSYILNGIFPLYKPKGMTSFELLLLLKETILKDVPKSNPDSLKVGHGGILDHPACGVLVAGAGNDCHLLKSFLKGEKGYRAEAILGVSTDTYNADGKVTMEKSFDHINHEMLQRVTQKFLGRIQQVPPLYSALKYRGERYSDLARKGIDVKLEPRDVQCFRIDILNFSPPFFSLYVECGGGFYVRSLVHDIGLALDSCAHVTALERTRQGPFTTEQTLRESDLNLKNVRSAIAKNKPIVRRYLNQRGKW